MLRPSSKRPRNTRRYRSIPAGAGEPGVGRRSSVAPGVYPRGCGGTGAHSNRATVPTGLSPRVRGNRAASACTIRPEGSIPAGAGEPRRAIRAPALGWVYPRGCGGTGRFAATATTFTGLSPRVRGNHLVVLLAERRHRSIPAGAGEPGASSISPRRSRVYPRGCGGTVCTTWAWAAALGLSPRVRGNRQTWGRKDAAYGSIPAGAGEPPTRPRGVPGSGVYPRGCGGTQVDACSDGYAWGLSPRVRGNPRWRFWVRWSIRSIPAGAGEPA